MKKFTGFLLFGLFLLIPGFGILMLQSTQNALSIWFEKLAPSVFLSMVLIRLLYREYMFGHLPSLGLPILLGMDQGAWNLVLCAMFPGSPTDSVSMGKAIQDGVLSWQDTTRPLYCCCFPTPGFIIISYGIVFFKSLHIGILLSALQLLSSLLLLLFTRRHAVHTFPVAVASSQLFMRNPNSAVTESGISLYMVGGYLMLFMSITIVLLSSLPEFPTLIIRSLAEFLSDIALINVIPFSTIQRLLPTSFLLGSTGFCVYMQITSMVERVPPRYPIFLLYRILQEMISVLLLVLCMQFLQSSYIIIQKEGDHMKIVWVGCGMMGTSMLLNLKKGDHTVSAYNRTYERVTPLLKQGIRVEYTIRDCVSDADAVRVVVGYPKNVEEICEGNGGIFIYIKAHAILTDLTTSSLALAKKLYTATKIKGYAMPGAPVSNGDSGAKAVPLSIMTGGGEEVLEQIRPLFPLLETGIQYMGEAGSGQHTRAYNQIATAGAATTVNGALVYTRTVELDGQRMFVAITKGATGSWQIDNTASRVLVNDFTPDFYIKHFTKGTRIVQQEMERRDVHLDMLETACGVYEALAGMGEENDGTQALVRYCR